VLVLGGTVFAPLPAVAQQTDSRIPPWQRRPTAQTVQTSPSAPIRVSTAVAANSTPQEVALPRVQQAGSRERQVSHTTFADSPMVTQGAPEEVYYEGEPSMAGLPSMAGPGPGSCQDCGVSGGGMFGDGYWGGGDCYGGGAVVPWWGFAPGRLWVRGESLLWWTEGASLPPLVTTSPRGTDQADAGVLPDADILFGGDSVNGGSRSGGRISFGLRPNGCSPWGIETSYMRLGSETTWYSGEGEEGRPILARPFNFIWDNDPDNELGTENAPASHLISFADDTGTLFEGSIGIEAATTFQGFELLMRRRVADWCTGGFDFVAGWRYWRLDDDLFIHENIDRLQDPAANIRTADVFRAENRFNGGELGFVAETQWCRWSFGALLKVAIGSTNSEVTIDGQTVVDEEATQHYGFLALPSNIGVYQDDAFAMVPEFGLNVGYDLTCHLRMTFGYTLVYWGQVARAGDQVSLDLTIPTDEGEQLGLARPDFPFAKTDFWAQGMNFGLEYRF